MKKRMESDEKEDGERRFKKEGWGNGTTQIWKRIVYAHTRVSDLPLRLEILPFFLAHEFLSQK